MKPLLIAVFAFTAFAGTAEAQQVRIASEGAYAPWNYIDDSGKLAGFEIELGTELCKRAALDCTFVQNAWDTMIPNLTAGNFDAIMAAMTITDERKQTIDFSDNYKPPTPSTFLVPSGSAADFAAPKGLRIGAQTGTIQAAYAEEHYKSDDTLVTFDTTDAALADLNAGNLDAIFAEKDYEAEVVAGSGGTLKIAGPEIPIGNGVGIGLRKTDDALEGQFNKAIGDMKTDGSLDAMIVKWFPEQGPGPYFKN